MGVTVPRTNCPSLTPVMLGASAPIAVEVVVIWRVAGSAAAIRTTSPARGSESVTENAPAAFAVVSRCSVRPPCSWSTATRAFA